MDHLSPDVLAAWMDGALSAAERSAAEAHAADCVHCQAMLAAIARTAPAAASRAWWTTGAVRWLVPVAAAMLLVWLGSSLDFPLRHHPDYTAAQNGKSRSEPTPARGEPQDRISETRSQPETKSGQPESARRKDVARHERARSTPVVPDETGQKRTDAVSPGAAVAAPNAAPVAAPPVAALPPPPADAPAAPIAGAPQPSAQTSAAAASPPPPALLPANESVKITAEDTASNKSARLALDALAPRPVEVLSPEHTYRWRALTPGSILYSIDGGVSWRSSSTGTSRALRAGSSPARSVCWLVGQAGTVLLTTDGQRWQVRPFPERVDLTDVRASDARNATVTTADRRRFATADGGATWSPLQEN